jgi:hypothetical protein
MAGRFADERIAPGFAALDESRVLDRSYRPRWAHSGL